MAAGLPVLQTLHITQHVQSALRIDLVFLEQRRDLCHRGVLELVQPRRQDVVHQLRGLLRWATEKALHDQYSVVELALDLHLTLVREEVVAQVHRIGERVAQHLHRPRPRDLDRHLRVDRVLDQVRRPGRPTHLAAHLDVLDRVGQPAGADVRQFPQGLGEQSLGGLDEPLPPARRHRRDRAVPEIGETALHRVLGRFRDRALDRHEGGQTIEVGLRPGRVLGLLVQLQEVVVEVEDPHVPVRHQVQRGTGRVGMGVGTEQRIVVGVEVVLVPDRLTLLGNVDHVELVGPGLAVRPGSFQVRVDPGRVGHIEVGQLVRLLRHRV